MLTQDDLQQIGKVIDARLDQKLEPIKTDLQGVKTEVHAVKADVQGVKTDLQEVKQGLARVEQKLDKEVTDLAENIHEIMTKLDTVNDHEKRITRLEEHAGFHHAA
ncbi:MAG TPA: hypothetical protein VFV38_29675 [Ktedonobacteraceae bacterium]|nr:hypothetical protein [Ktedonobacteraceae bacterium]